MAKRLVGRPRASEAVPGGVVSTAEAAKRVGVSRQQIWRLVRSGRLPGIMVGRQYVIRLATLQRYLSWRQAEREHHRLPFGRRERRTRCRSLGSRDG